MIVNINKKYLGDWNWFAYTLFFSIATHFIISGDKFDVYSFVTAIGFSLLVILVGLLKLIFKLFKSDLKIKWFCYLWLAFFAFTIFGNNILPLFR